MEKIKFLKAFIVFSTLSVLLGGVVVGQLQAAFLVLVLGVDASKHASDTITNVTGFICSMVVCFFVFRWVIRRFILTQIEKGGLGDEA